MIKDQPIHIVSVYSTGTSNESKPDIENIKRHYAIMQQLKEQGLSFQELYSSYKGKPERSLAFEGDHHKPLVDRIAKEYNQESTLRINPNGDTELHFADRKEPIGKWQEVTKEEAIKSGSYSYDPSTKTYWIAK